MRLPGQALLFLSPVTGNRVVSEVGEAERLRKLIHEPVLTGRGLAAHAGGGLLVNGQTDERPPQVLVCPIHSRRQNMGFPDGRVCAVVFFSTPDAPENLPAESLRVLYGLTHAETRLALELAKGRGLNEIAEEFDITKGTGYNSRPFSAKRAPAGRANW